jgi:hypothetical protein
MWRRPMAGLAVLVIGLGAILAGCSKESPGQVGAQAAACKLRGEVVSIGSLGDYEGPAILAANDPRFVLIVRPRWIICGNPPLEPDGTVRFAIHSPVMLLGATAEGCVGKTYTFTASPLGEGSQVLWLEATPIGPGVYDNTILCLIVVPVWLASLVGAIRRRRFGFRALVLYPAACLAVGVGLNALVCSAGTIVVALGHVVVGLRRWSRRKSRTVAEDSSAGRQASAGEWL